MYKIFYYYLNIYNYYTFFTKIWDNQTSELDVIAPLKRLGIT